MSYNEGHSRAPWRKAIIVPLWSLQVAFLSIDVIVLAILIAITGNAPGTLVIHNNDLYSIMPSVQIWDVINLIIASICLFLTCTEIIIFQNRDLTPTMFLWSTVFKIVIWTGATAYDMSAAGTQWFWLKLSKIYLGVAVGFAGVILLSYIGTLIYAICVYRQVKKREKTVYESYVAGEETRFNTTWA